MIKSKNVKHIIDFSEYLLTFINLIIVFRMIIISIDIDMFRDDVTGKLNSIGNNVKFIQMVAEKITNPIIDPFKNLLISLTKTEDLGLISVLAPASTIIGLLMIMVLLKVLTPNIVRYINRLNRE